MKVNTPPMVVFLTRDRYGYDIWGVRPTWSHEKDLWIGTPDLLFKYSSDGFLKNFCEDAFEGTTGVSLEVGQITMVRIRLEPVVLALPAPVPASDCDCGADYHG